MTNYKGVRVPSVALLNAACDALMTAALTIDRDCCAMLNASAEAEVENFAGLAHEHRNMRDLGSVVDCVLAHLWSPVCQQPDAWPLMREALAMCANYYGAAPLTGDWWRDPEQVCAFLRGAAEYHE